MRRVIIILLAVYGFLTIFSCANRGMGPQGGPMDTTPPQVTKYSPADGSINMQKNHIEITFDEIVTLDNPYQKVIISPPQKSPAEVKAISHKVVINFIDSLIDSTTYTIDFTDAIQDNNEGNKLKNFSYCFSTGDFIDTLQISGRVIEAANHNPVVGIVIGVQSNLEDSAFTTLPFKRITKTDEKGHFVIKNLAAGSYHIFALNDIGSNYLYDMPNEKIAFLDTVLTPTCRVSIHRDTVFMQTNSSDSASIKNDSVSIDSMAIDTIITHTKYIYEPKNILLKAFTEPDLRQYLLKNERKERYRMNLYFNQPVDSTPDLRPINIPDSMFRPVISYSRNRDTLTYWLTDTAIWAIDTLLFEYKHDTVTDTLQFLYRVGKQTGRKGNSFADTGNKSNNALGGNNKSNQSSKRGDGAKGGKKGKGKKEEEKPTSGVTKLSIPNNASSSFDVYKPLQLSFSMPTKMNERDTVSYHLEIKKDTLWIPVKGHGKLKQVDSIGTTYTFEHKWIPDTTYRFVIDSGLFKNMVGHVSSKEILTLQIKSLEQYSKLILHMKNTKGNEVIQLIDKDEKVVMEQKVDKKDIIFEYITPATYYLRLFRDENGDGKWSSGKYSEKKQPEEVFYFPFDIELRAFWDVEEDWDPESTPLLKQKPKELIKVEENK